MNLEQQVTSLELSKRLKELGVKQESYAWWIQFKRKDNEHPSPQNPPTVRSESEIELYDGGSFGNYEYKKLASAFTVAELGEMLPPNATSFRMKKEASERLHALWVCRAEESETHTYADTEADARAKMFIYLLENNLLQQQKGKEV